MLNSVGNALVIFPLAFESGVRNIVASAVSEGSYDENMQMIYGVLVVALNNTQCVITTGLPRSNTICWICIGY